MKITLVCVTGQHRSMLDQVLEAFGVVPDYDLLIMKDKQALFDITAGVLEGMRKILENVRPNIVLVHGDTSTTFVSALAAFYLQISVGHVEAGLRTYKIYSPYPEEFNREAVGAIASLNFAPTVTSRENLVREGKSLSSVFVTGNTAIDALQTTIRDSYEHKELEWAAGKRMILITARRRENLGEPMEHMFRAIKRVLDEHEDVRAIYPIHMNPVVRETAASIFGDDERVHIIEPLDVLEVWGVRGVLSVSVTHTVANHINVLCLCGTVKPAFLMFSSNSVGDIPAFRAAFGNDISPFCT